MDTKAFIKTFMNKMQNIQEKILDYLNEEESQESQLFEFFNEQKLRDNKHDFKIFLHFISKISQNTCQTSYLFPKIFGILKFFQEDITKYFSNNEIFNIFKSSKRILLFLFENKIITMNEFISHVMKSKKYKNRYYIEFFYPEIKPFISEAISSSIISEHPEILTIEEFDKLRKTGQNSYYVCELIRNDSIDEFIKYVNRKNLSLNMKISPTIYETNNFLLDNDCSFIQYSAFFGSIQIFKYLYLNNVEVDSTIWLYEIHGKNAELIHFLEENKIEPPNNDDKYYDVYNLCCIESIKCHHNDFMNYIKNNLFKKITNEANLFPQSLKNYNFIDICNNDYINDDQITFISIDFIRYDYYEIVDFLIKNNKINIKSNMILY